MTTETIYQRIEHAVGEDNAYYLARTIHRYRTSTIETQIAATISDALTQYRLDRVEFAAALLDVLDTHDLPPYAARILETDSAHLRTLLA